jgi:integrase
MGIRDDGKPDRRHVERKTEAEVIEAVRALEKQRDSGKVRKAGRSWTVEKWLTHWLDNIALPSVRYKAGNAQRTAVNRHLIPNLGAHRVDKIEPEHFEKLYAKMLKSGLKSATAHQVHRTARTAFGEALRRGHITRNPVELAKPPRVEEKEIEPFDANEIGRLLVTALSRRNGVRFVLALAARRWFGRGRREVVGRPPGHRAAGPALRPADDTRGTAGQGAGARRVRVARGEWMFTQPNGKPLDPRRDLDEWKALLEEAGVREARLHDARHTAATVLLVLGVPERAVMEFMGWSNSTMAKRYQHMTGGLRRDIANQLNEYLWKPERKTKGKRRKGRKKGD